MSFDLDETGQKILVVGVATDGSVEEAPLSINFTLSHCLAQ